jgi:hypothetical protein
VTRLVAEKELTPAEIERIQRLLDAQPKGRKKK